MGKILLLASGKGGVGKSVSAINLALALNELGKEVLLVDGNVSMPNIALMLGCPKVPVALNHVLLGKKSVEEAIYEHSSGTKVIPAAFSPEASTEKLCELLLQLKHSFDFVLLDSGPGIDVNVLKAANQVLAVTTPELPAIADTLKTVKLSQKQKKQVVGVIVTRLTKEKQELSLVRTMLELPLLGKIPEDKKVKESIAARRPLYSLYPRSKAARAYKELALRLIHKNYKKSLWQRFLDYFKKVF